MLSNKSIFRCALISISAAVMTLTGCNQYSENGVLGDYVSASKCPANGCADQAPDPNYVSLKASVTTLNVAANENRAEISGDCYPSTYPKNQINVTVTQSSGAVVSAPAVNVSTDAVAPTCKNGRFNVILGTAAMPAGSLYNVKLELVGIDSAGGRHVNAAGGNATIALRK